MWGAAAFVQRRSAVQAFQRFCFTARRAAQGPCLAPEERGRGDTTSAFDHRRGAFAAFAGALQVGEGSRCARRGIPCSGDVAAAALRCPALRGNALVAVLLAAALVVACGEDEGSEATRRGPTATGSGDQGRGTGQGDEQQRPPSTVEKPKATDTRGKTPGESCRGAIRVNDPPHDTRAWRMPEPTGRPPTPASADLRRFELRADARGVCAVWTTAAPAPRKTVLVLNAHGPPDRQPGGAIVSHGHGFEVELLARGGRVTSGLDRLGSDEPRVLRAQVRQFGRTVTAFVARAELDRPPANMPDRPTFPFRAFIFEARVITPRDRRGGQDADFWPQERPKVAQAAYIGGRLCSPPCRDRRVSFPGR